MSPAPKKRPAKQPTPFTGRRLLFILLGVFAVVLGVNGTMVYYAKESFTGVTSPRAYEEGLAYNQTLSARKALEARGLTLHRQATATALTYTLGGPENAPRPTTATLTFTRPLGEQPAQTVTCSVAGMALTCPFPVLAQGQWHLALAVQLGTESVSVEDQWLQP